MVSGDFYHHDWPGSGCAECRSERIAKRLHHVYGKPPEGVDVLWRVEARSYSYVIDADREEYGTTAPRLELSWHRVQRRTPKGAWIYDKFVLLTAGKRWACNTIDEAVESFAARRRRQVKILEAKLKRAKFELELTR